MTNRDLLFLECFIAQCNLNNSTKEKQAVIQSFYDQDFDLFTNLMLLVFDYHNKYYVTSDNITKMENDIEPMVVEDNMTIFDLCHMLSNRLVTGHEAISLILGFINKFNEHKDTILRVLDKDLGCRIDAKTINKVIPNLIPTFDVSLGEKVEWDRFDWQTTPWYISRKIDGCLHYDTSVLLSDGSYKPIGEIVENKLDVEVISYNEISKKFENKRITNYMKNGVENNEVKYIWFEIELENGTKIKLTGNHKVYLPELKCYRRVDELKGDENILYTI